MSFDIDIIARSNALRQQKTLRRLFDITCSDGALTASAIWKVTRKRPSPLPSTGR